MSRDGQSTPHVHSSTVYKVTTGKQPLILHDKDITPILKALQIV